MAYDYSRAGWDGLRDHLRDVPWEDIFKLSASAAASEFCEWVQVGIDVYIPHRKYQVKPHSSPWFSAACVAAIVHRNHFFRLYQQNKSSESKVKFRQASNRCKRVLEAAKLAYATKTKESITSQKLGSRDFWRIANSVLNKGKSAVPPLFNGPEVLSSASDKAKLFAQNFSKNSNLLDSGISLPVFPSRTNLKLHNIYITPKMVKKVVTNLDSSKEFGPDCIPVVVLKNNEPELSYILAKLFNNCLKESCFPDCWKVSSVVPVFKNVGERSTAKTFGINFKNTSVQSVRDIVNSYKNHPSIIKIKQVVNGSNVSDSERFSFKTINESEIKDLLKNLDINKASGIDTIPPKLVKLSADFLTPLLTKAINTSIAQNVFPENAKTASVIPLDKGKPNKNEMSNFRPVSVLNTFSKIYERVIKDQIVHGMEKYFSPFLSAYRKNYSSQNILISLTEEWRKMLDNNFVVGAVLTDLSKAFDCIPHDLIIAKLSAYNFSDEALSYIYSYLTNRRQCVRINNTHSQLETIISGVPQGSILGPILFNLSINDLFFFVVLASLYNFADDNTLSAFATTVSELIKILESESEVVIDWFKINKMVVNPDKFQAIILDKRKRDHTDEHITVDNQQIKVVSSVKLLGLQLDDKLNFNLHISNICKSAANQLNALIRLKKFMNFEEKKILINSYFMANFNYCPLVWMLSNASSLKKIENLQKRALRFLCNDYEISYEELLSKSSTSSMNVKRLRALCVELYKTINKLNPDFMRDLFKLRFTNRPVREKYKMNMIIPEFNQVSYGKKSLRTFGPKLWNSLPYHIKSSENLESFKRTIKHWNGERCLCKVCNCS